ncbi:DUF3168 domain-containing protein [Mesorhizobium koreense]|uniref:DUF3168 domain-containing protein n=1 Tax=Mesorhizobium koreense TaxID=3074855 RepID=UPI00287BB1F9|nr:DUF3168 domain-containing protein [Mesorhizobium sp. WR6]
MTEPSLAVQIAIRSALIASPAVTGIVPSAHIFDRRTRPELFPCIIIGDANTALEPITLTRSHVRLFADLHIWTEESGLETVKTVAGNVGAALRSKPSIDGFHVVDWKMTGTRFLRDPGGEYGHAITSIEVLLNEAPQ